MSKRHLGSIVRDKRRELGLLQKDVAEAVGMTRETYSQLETGRRKEPVSPDQARRISQIFDLSMFIIVDAMGYELPFAEAGAGEVGAVLLEAYQAASDDRRQIAQLALGLGPENSGDPRLESLRRLAARDRQGRRGTQE